VSIAIHDPELDQRVKRAGASRTVYALVTPETEAAKRLILGNDVGGPDAERRHYLEQFRDAWSGKQFASHEAFIQREASADPADHIPFRQEAALFANIYWSNRRRYETVFPSIAKSN
jgi:hypothetical protein